MTPSRLSDFRRWLFLAALLSLSLVLILLFRGDSDTSSRVPAKDSTAQGAPLAPPATSHAPSAPRADMTVDAKSETNPVANPRCRWGGALNSVALDGADFFNPAHNREFNATIEDALKKYIVDLNARSFLPLVNADLTEIFSPDEQQPVVYLQFIEHPTVEQRAQLTALGVELLAYMTGYAWMARGAPETLKATQRLDFVRALARIDPRDKLLPEIFAGHQPEYALAPDGRTRFMLLTLPGTHLDALTKAIKQQPALADAEARNAPASVLGPRFEVIAARATAEALAALPMVRFLEFVSPPVASRDATTDISSNITQVRDFPPNLNGAGVKVAVREIGKPTAHVDFASRLTYVEDGDSLFDEVKHSTAVCGVIGSNGNNQPTAKGVAPNVSLLAYAVNSPAGTTFATTDITTAAGQGARFSNHSYGPNVTAWGDYRTDSANWDQAARDHNVLGAFAGNEEPGQTYKRIDFFVGAKNTICVGATNAIARAGPPPVNGIASFSQFGPMNDGRVKPDLVAFGQGVTLCNGVNSTTINSGTSFATPVVTGVAALVFQQYKAKTGSEPSAALTKALLCNSATDLGLPGPDAQYGFGIVNALEAINTINLQTSVTDGPFYEGTLNNGETRSFTMNVQTSTPLKVTLCWLDVAGNLSPTKALVNDLDLKLTSPGGATIYPFSLNPANPSAAATATGSNAVDPIEQVVVSVPALGVWTVTIKATSIPNGSQSFAVCLNKPKVPLPLQAIILASPTEGGAPLNVSFSASASVGNIVSYAWTFGDQTAGQVANLEHTYAAPGTYTVTLIVTDAMGAQSSATIIITVSKRIVQVFPSKARARLDFRRPDHNHLQFSLVIPELLLTPQQWRNAIKDGSLTDKTFDVTIGQTKLAQFKIDNRGRFKSKSQSLKLNQSRGELIIQFNNNPNLTTIFSQYGMTSDPNSSGNYKLPVQVETEGAVYQATFELLYKNIRGVRATAR
ncbi:MAG: S8 family serine peptidase [Planctomycetota bacterium]